MPPDLTDDEISFFQTGVLPESLVPAAQEEEAPAPKVEEDVAPKVEEAPRVTHDWNALNEQQRRINERLDAIASKLEARDKPAPVPEPNEESDPLGAMLHKLNTVVNEVGTLKTQLQKDTENAALRNEFQQFTDNIKTLKAEFTKDTPDFDAAYAHIRAVRTEDLLATGTPKADVQGVLFNDEVRLAAAAVQAGKNPAAEMYAMAKRYGYAPAKAGAPAPKTGVAETADEKVARLKNGQFAAKQPARSGTEVDLTLGGLAEASSTDLDKVVGNDNEWARIVGGRSGGNDVLH